MKICLLSSTGGHLAQLLEVKKFVNEYDTFFVTFKGADSISLINTERVYFLPYYGRDIILSIINLLPTIVKSFQILFKERPDILITTGASWGILLCYFSLFFKTRIIFIESFGNLKKPTMFGQLIHPFSKVTIVQWKSLRSKYKGSIYGGSLYDFSQSKIFPHLNYVYVTVGSTQHQFDRLIEAVDNLALDNSLPKFIAQIGSSTYVPKNMKYFRYTSSITNERLIKKSKLIISHSGTGSFNLSLKYFKPIIGVARLKKYGEHVNNHQKQILEQFAKLGLVDGISDLVNLKKSIKRAKLPNPKFEVDRNIKEIILENVDIN